MTFSSASCLFNTSIDFILYWALWGFDEAKYALLSSYRLN